MPQAHGRNALVVLYDNAGASRDLSGDHNTTTLTWSRDNPETTTYGKDTTQRIAGLRDATLTGAGIWNTGASALDSILAGIMAGSGNTLVRFAPVGVTGCPLYTGCMTLNSYEITPPVNGAVAFSYSLQMASGSISASTV